MRPACIVERLGHPLSPARFRFLTALVDQNNALAVASPFGFQRPHEFQDRGLAKIAAAGPLLGIHAAGDPGVELLAVDVPGQPPDR
jgi:hypothetical protein